MKEQWLSYFRFLSVWRGVVYSQYIRLPISKSIPRTFLRLCRHGLCAVFSILLTLIATLAPARAAEQASTKAPAKAAAPKPDVQLGAVDSIINQAIAEGNIPGAVLVVGHNGKVVYRKAY